MEPTPGLTNPPVPPVVRGPVTGSERSLAPDLARGVMLAFIALANTPLFLYDRPIGRRMHLVEDGLADRVTTFVITTFVDGRAYPMFAALFGYGMVQLLHRQLAAGGTPTTASWLLWRRNGWLLLFGFVHALVLFPGDILGAYAVAGWLTLTVIHTSDRRLLLAAAALVIPVVVLGSTTGLVPAPEATMVAGLDNTDPVGAAVTRVTDWTQSSPFTVFIVLLPMALGIWAGRRRFLEEPERHRTLLRRVAVVGLTAAVVGGLPLSLTVARVLPSYGTGTDLAFGALHSLSGVAGGLGYAALIGLVAARLRGRAGAATTAIAACGARSLTCYLAQSVVFVLVLTAGVGGLGGTVGSAGAAVLALATWALTVVGADVLRRLGRRGPAEVLLRRLTYRGVDLSRSPGS
jgi:uncharacterized protein